MRKRLPKISIFIAIFLIIGLFGTFFFIRSQTFLNWVEGRLETELKNRITDDYTASIGKIEGNILGSVSVKNVEISNEGKPIISTGEVSLIYNPLGLLTRKFEVKKLKVDTPQIHVEQNPDGKLNLSNIFQEDLSNKNTPQFGFAIESLDFTDGTINYIDTQRNLDITINGISVKMEGPLNTWKHDGTLKIETGSFTFNGSKTAIDNFDAEFSILANSNELKNLYIKFGNSDLTVTGGYTHGKTPFSWNGRVNLELDVADVQQFLSEDINLEGVVKADLRMNGTDSTLDSTLAAEMPTFSITEAAASPSQQIALANLNVEANFNTEPTPIFTLKTFRAQVADGTMTSDGSVTLENPLEGNLLKQFQQLANHPFNYTGKWSLTEAQLIPLLSMFVELPENLADSTGVLSGTAEFNGNSTDISSLKFDSQIVVMETTLDEIKFEDSTLNCTIADGNLTADGNLDETEVNITGPFPLAQQDILDIRVSGVNFDDLMKLAKSADIGGTAELSAQLSDGILKGSIEIPEATFNDIPIGLLTGDFRYHDGKVFIENGLLTKNTIEKSSAVSSQQSAVKAELENPKSPLITTKTEYQSRAIITGAVDVEGEFPANFSVVADPVYVQHYPRVLLGAEYPVDGEIRGELKLDGTLINLDGRANFSVTKGVAWGIHLDPLTLPLEIEDYNFTLPNFKITTRGQQVTLNVSVAPNSDYDLLLENDAPVRFEEIAKAANISDFPFEGEFDVRVVGKLRKPENADFRVELDFSDVTFLNNGRGTKHLLGDVYLLGKLIERKNTTGEPDIFDFHGHGFEGTSQIRGYVSMDTGNPYHFTAENKAFAVKPILSILHPIFETFTGTADGSASISGTLEDLAPSPEAKTTESDKKRIYPYDVDILVRELAASKDASVPKTSLSLPTADNRQPTATITNTEPIRLHLKGDKWTIDALSLRTSEDKSPFIALTGTFDAKSETMNLHAVSDEFALPPFGNALGLPLDMLQTGTARYDLKVTGTSSQPIVRLEWAIPALTLKTEVGDIDATDAGGTIIYQEEALRFAECAFKLFGNDVNLEGYVDVHPEDANNSELHLRVDTSALDLATLPIEVINNLGSSNGITGILGTSMEIGGTLAEPLALLYAKTTAQHPIRFAAYIPAITLEKLRVDMNFDSEFVRVQKAEANGQIGDDGAYRAQGEAVFPRQKSHQASTNKSQLRKDSIKSDPSLTDNRKLITDNYFEIDVSASQVEVGNYGIASGHVKLSGTSLDPQQITVIGEINKLELDRYDFRLTNSAPLQFRSDPIGITGATEPLAGHIPLQLTSPTMTALMNVDIGGTFDTPNITAAWNGTLNQKEWTGNVQYRNSQIELIGITLKDGTDMLTLTGVIPFNLTFTAMDISERFLAEPVNMRLRGSELPLNFFPGIDTLFSEADGTVDIDLALQGTSRDPHITGNVSLEAPQLHLKNFHEPIQNMKMQLKADDGAIDVTELQFDIGTGYCKLEQGQLALDGLTPKDFTVTGLRFELFPLGSTVQQALPSEVFEEVTGHLSTTLNELTVPLDNFLTSGENGPLPQIQEIPSLADLIAVSSADVSIKSVRLGFKALNQQYDFQDPQPIQIFLNDGTVTLSEAFIFENEYPFPVKQTFTDEDEKPMEIVGNVHTVEEAKTTLSIDAESKWSVNGEFDGALRFKNFDISAITETWPAPYRITGALSGSLQMSGTSENPKITLRRHENEPAELYLYDVPIDLRWRIRYQNGKWEISERRYLKATFGENQINFSWSMPYQLELIPFFTALQQTPEKVWTEFQQTPMRGILDIAVADLDMLRFVVPGLRSTIGTSEIHVELTGTIETPEANGGILFKNVGFELPDAGIDIKNVEGKLQLSEKGANITQFDGMLNGGNFSVRGSMTAPPDRRIWQTPPTLEVNANLTSTVFEQQGQYRVDLDSTEFYLQGELLRPRLTGNLHINGGYYQQNWEIVRDWLTGVSVKETDILLDYPILRDLQLDVDINIPNNFRVLSSITGPTDIEISYLGKLIGPINQPVLSGNVSVLQGKVGFFAQTFEIVEGSTISNQSAVDFNPVLNVHLQTPNRIRGILPRNETTVDLQVFGALTGTLNNPNFTLSASSETTTEVLTDEEITAFLFRNHAFSGELGRFTFSLHRPFEEDVRSISAEYPLGKNISIKIETNERREHGIDVELKGRF